MPERLPRGARPLTTEQAIRLGRFLRGYPGHEERAQQIDAFRFQAGDDLNGWPVLFQNAYNGCPAATLPPWWWETLGFSPPRSASETPFVQWDGVGLSATWPELVDLNSATMLLTLQAGLSAGFARGFPPPPSVLRATATPGSATARRRLIVPRPLP